MDIICSLPPDSCGCDENGTDNLLSLSEVCTILSISSATGKNWLRLGKLESCSPVGGKPVFRREYIEALLETLKSDTSVSLKKRRNKKQIKGVGIYKDYIECSEVNVEAVRQIIAFSGHNPNTAPFIGLIVAEYAIRLLIQAHKMKINTDGSYLSAYLNGEFTLGIYNSLVDDLIRHSCGRNINESVSSVLPVLGYEIEYIKEQDILGLIYISIKCLGERKAFGAYFTPAIIVKKAVDALLYHVNADENLRILDPCCGTGNFLLYLASKVSPECIHGQDIDRLSVMITRINLALEYDFDNIDILYNNITCGDTLKWLPCDSYDCIIGNPPWGYSFSKEVIKELYGKYETISANKIESFDIFIENAINHLADGGIGVGIFPKALLNVASHHKTRQFLINKACIKSVEYAGDIFSGVQCPSIIAVFEKGAEFRSEGIRIKKSDSEFIIGTNRKLTADCFNLELTDSEYSVLSRLENAKNLKHLKNNAEFAMGIVTGNNKLFLSEEKDGANEWVIKGSDVFKYRINEPENYLNFSPESFQQTADSSFYRAEEKLVYRFICDTPVFAYDDKQRVTLNSCNILIPHIDGLWIKYILAVLNSRAVQFYFSGKFSSIKVLRSHIEQLPIPYAEMDVQSSIIESVNRIISSSSADEITELYEKIDLQIMDLFELDTESRDIIQKSCPKTMLGLVSYFLPK